MEIIIRSIICSHSHTSVTAVFLTSDFLFLKKVIETVKEGKQQRGPDEADYVDPFQYEFKLKGNGTETTLAAILDNMQQDLEYK